MNGPKSNSRRGRDERHGAMSAAAEVIIKNAKAAQDAKTEKLRKLREARDAASPDAGTADPKPPKKRKTSRSIPVDKLTSQNDV